MEEIFVPALGMAMSEAGLLAWLKEPGESVAVGATVSRLSVAWRLTAILNVDHRVWDGLDAAELLSDFGGRTSAYGRYGNDD